MLRSSSLAAAGALALAAAVGLAPAATADPGQYHKPFVPDASDIVGVGSDTTQFVVNDLADGTYDNALRTAKRKAFVAGYNAKNPADRLASFDAFRPGTTPPKAGDPIVLRPRMSIARPDGSSAGITALLASPRLPGTDHDVIDFARSSRGPKESGEQSLAFIKFAVDSVAWARNASLKPAPGNLTQAQLKGIVNCTTTNWKQVGGPNLPIVVMVPQEGSGTRSFYLKKLGITDPGKAGLACWKTVQEHDSTPVIRNRGAIAPFSVARYLAPKGAVVRGMVLGSLDGKPATVSRGRLLNTSYPFTRDVYNVVKRTGGQPTGAVPDRLAKVFGDGKGRAGSLGGVPFVCSTQGKAIIEANGFGFSRTCGKV